MIKNYELCNIVAEACCNHMGDIDIAVEMIKTAKLCGANYIKFQKRYLELAVTKEMQKSVHPNPQHSFGSTYMEHRKALEFDIHQHDYLKRICDEYDIGYACSVWDKVSAEEIIELNVDFIKIPSAMNGNYKLLDFVYKNYLGNVHISLGMISKEKINELFDYLKQYQNRTVVYWTTSGYPVKFDELFLLEINNIIDNGFYAGYSGHHLGIAVDIAAYTLGVQWIERHFTLDRTWKGTDHAASLEPAGLKKLCRDISAAQKSFKYKNGLTLDEQKNSQKLRIEEGAK